MRRPVRRSRLLVLASLTTVFVGTMLLTVGPVAAARPTAHPLGQEPTVRGGELRAGARPAYRHVDVSALPEARRGDQSSSSKLLTPMAGSKASSGTDTFNLLEKSVGTAPPATEVTAFPGLEFADPPGIEPPDPWVAVGPEHVIQAVNTTIRISDRTGNALRTVDMYDFFGLDDVQQPYFAELFDPRVIYDSLHGRWVAVETSFDCLTGGGITAGTGYIDIATSDSADPMGTWRIFSIFFDDAVPDYPGLGTSTDKIAVSGNVFALAAGGGLYGCHIDGSPAGFIASDVEVMAWSEMLGGGPVDLESFNGVATFPGSYITWRPALQTPATSATLSLVAYDGTNGNILFARVTGSPAGSSASSMSAITDLTAAAILPALSVVVPPPPPQQPGTPTTIVDAVDGRLTDAIWQNDRLTTVSTYACDVAPPSTNRDCVRVSQLNTGTSTPTARQDFFIGEDDKDLYMGGVGYAGNGDLHISWTRSSAVGNDYPSSYITRQPAAVLAGELAADDGTGPYGTLTGEGTGTYPGTRWGDYVGVAQDPQVPNAVWQANQFSAGVSYWATNVSQLQTGGATYVPVAPLRVLDSRVNLGVTGIFNASTPKSFTVAGFTSSGGSIPADAIAVTGNVTVADQTANGFISVTTTPTSTPGSSTLNFPVKDARANNVTAPVASNGKLSVVYKAAAGKKAHIIFDVTGYFLPGTEDAAYNTLAPTRVLDSRAAYGIGLTGRFLTGVPRQLVIAGNHDVPAGAVAVTANLTVAGQTKGGFVSITPTAESSPTTSNINFPVGDTRANGLTAKLGDDGDIWLVYKSAAGSRTDLILDVTGYYLPAGDGLVFHALNPGRVMDTRTSLLSGLTGAFNHNVSRALDTDGHWGVPAGANAVTGNLTVTGQTKGGFVAITPDLDPAPLTSTINFPLGDTRANGVTVPLNGSGNMSLIYRATAGNTHLILDVTGYFE